MYVFDSQDQTIGLIKGGGLSWPNDVAVDSNGDLYVTGVNTDDIRKYDSSGAFQYAVGGGGLDHPTGLCLAPGGVLYVAGSASNNVVKYDTGGGVLGVLTHADFASPQSLAIDDQGLLYVTQFFSNEIVVFDLDDQYLRTIPGAPVDAPRGLAFFPGAPSGVREPTVARPFGDSPRAEAAQVIPSPPGSVRIGFHLPESRCVSIDVFTPLGSLIWSRPEEHFPSGRNEVVWPGEVRDGRSAPAGIYFFRLGANGEQSTGSVLLTR